jgi:hypothetical protein
MLIVVSWRDRRNHPLLSLAKLPQPSVAILGNIAATIRCYPWQNAATICCLSDDHRPHPIACWPTGYYSAALIFILICIYPMHQARTIRTPRFAPSTGVHGGCQIIGTHQGGTPHARTET